MRGDSKILEQMVAISEMAEISYVYQKQQLGPGHAVLAAKSAIGHEPFAVFFPDDLILSEVPTIGTMIEMFNEYGQSVIAVGRVQEETIPSKGIVKPQLLYDNVYQVLDLIEKPSIQDAPSNLAIVGRYVLTADIFDALESLNPSTGGEIWLTDAISELLKTQKVYGYEFPGIQFDVGTPMGLQMASVYEALHREDTSEQFRAWIKGIL
jgi:UTP--glucose-1-phosphate uridylyltransferase